MNSNGNDNNDQSGNALPPGWKKGFSRSQNKTYYYHPETKHQQWHFPTATEAANPLLAKERLKKRSNDHGHNPHQPPQKKSAPNNRPTAATASSNTSALGDIVSSDHLNKLSSRMSASATSSSSSSSSSALSRKSSNLMTDNTRSVAIIVPYRDIHPKQQRSRHLKQFVPFMIKFLSNQLHNKNSIVDYHIYIIEQSNDERKFNRGKLLNIGFDIAKKNKCRKGNGNNDSERMVDHDVFIFHDVDLLPTNDEVLGPYYTQFPSVPIHIARVWDRYSNNPKYFGGIVSFSASDMKRINGYPNTFWGWGGEDDEMQKRCERLNLKWKSPTVPPAASASSSSGNRRPLITDLEAMNIEQKLNFLRANKEWKCNVKWEALNEHEATWRRNGLADLNYKILAMTDLDSDRMKNNGKGAVRSRATKVTVDVKLNGDHWTNKKCHINDTSYCS